MSADPDDAREVVACFDRIADIVVPQENREEMGRAERVLAAIRYTRRRQSLIDHLLLSLSEWEPPTTGPGWDEAQDPADT